MISGWRVCGRRILNGFRALRKRGQSETLGVALLTGVVLILVAVVGLFLFADFGADDEEQLLANIQGDVEATNITLSHEGGDTFEPGSIEVILTGDTTAEYSLSEFSELSGSNSKLEPGDTWRKQVSDFILGEGQLLVIHEPTNTILLDIPYSVETAEEGVTFRMTDWEDNPDDTPTNTGETTIYKGPKWNYSVQAQFPDNSTLSVDPGNVSFDFNETGKLSKTDGKLDATGSGNVTATVTVDQPGINESDEMEITILDSEPKLTVSSIETGKPSSLSINSAGISTQDTAKSSAQSSTPIMEGDKIGVKVVVEATEPVEVTDNLDLSLDTSWADNKTRTVTTDQSGETVNASFDTEETDNPASGWEYAGIHSVSATMGESGTKSEKVELRGRAFYNVSFADTGLTVIDLLGGTLVKFDANVTIENIGHVTGKSGRVNFDAVESGSSSRINFNPGQPKIGALGSSTLGKENGEKVSKPFSYSKPPLSVSLSDSLNLELEADVPNVESNGVTTQLESDGTNYNITILNVDPDPVGEGDDFEVEVEVDATDDSAASVDTLELDTGGLDGTLEKSDVSVGESRNFTIETESGDSDDYTIKAIAKVGIAGIGEKVGNDTADVEVKTPAQFNITEISAADTVDPGESFDVSYNVTNTGGVTDTQFINFNITNENGATVNNSSVEVELSPKESAIGSSLGSLPSFSYTPQDGDQPRLTATVASDDDAGTTQVDVPYNLSFTVNIPDFNESASNSTDVFADNSLPSSSLGSSGSLGGSQLYGGGTVSLTGVAGESEDNETEQTSGPSVNQPEATGGVTTDSFEAKEGLKFTRPVEPGQGVKSDVNDGIFGFLDDGPKLPSLDVSGKFSVRVTIEGGGGAGADSDVNLGDNPILYRGGSGGTAEATIDVSGKKTLDAWAGLGGKGSGFLPGGSGVGGYYGNATSGVTTGYAGFCGGGEIRSGGGGGATGIEIDGNLVMTADGGAGGGADACDENTAKGGDGGGGSAKGNLAAENGNAIVYSGNYDYITGFSYKGGGSDGGSTGDTSSQINGSDGSVRVISELRTVDVSDVSLIKVQLEGPGGGGGEGCRFCTSASGGNGGFVTTVLDVSEFDEIEIFVGEGGGRAALSMEKTGRENLMTTFADNENTDITESGHGGYGAFDGGAGGEDTDVGDIDIKSGGGGGATAVRAGDGTYLAVAGGGGGAARERSDAGTDLFGGYGGGGGAPGGDGGISQNNDDKPGIDAESSPTVPDVGGDGRDYTKSGKPGKEGSAWVNSAYSVQKTVVDGDGAKGGGIEERGNNGRVEILGIFNTGAELSNLNIDGQGENASIFAGNGASLSVKIKNTGDRVGDFIISRNISNETTSIQVDETVSGLSPDETETVNFDVPNSLYPDEYDVTVSTGTDSLSGTLNVTVNPADFKLTLTNVTDEIEEDDDLVIGYKIENDGDFPGTADEVQLNIDGYDSNPAAVLKGVSVPANGTTDTIILKNSEIIKALADAGLVTVVESDADNTTEARPPVVAP